MPAARGVKRTASKTVSATSASVPKSKKKRVAFQLEVPTAPNKRGSVFTCGQGDVGQLGLGEDVIETTKFKYVSGLGDKIVDVFSGGMHTIALDSDGKVWTFGCNDEGALGRATAGEAEEGAPGRVKLPGAAVAVSAGDSHSAALLDDGQVFAWGAFRDSHGSMGLIVRGREGKSCREPVKIDIGETAASIASGGDHLVILSTSGGVYTMGCGEQGQLGRLAQRSASRDARQGFSALLTPGKVTLKWAASHVWAGYHATFALDGASDKMFAWGLNNYGQLGITGEKRKTALYSPTECDAFAEGGWRAVAAGQHHSLALDARGLVRAVGRCEYGRLGLGDREGDAETLEVVPALSGKTCVSIAAGTCNSFAVTDTGEVLAWGMGSEGQLGTGAAADAAAPTPALPAALGDRRPRKVAAGAQHTALLAIDTSPVKEKTPEPEMETEEQPVEKKREDKKEKAAGRNRRHKRDEQEDEVSSTSSAQPSEPAEENKPQKVNGDEKKETPMDVDETDNTHDKKDDTKPEPEPAKTETEPAKVETEPAKTETEPVKTETEPAKTETEPKETKESEKESQPEPENKSEVPEASGETTDKPQEEKQEDTVEKPDVDMKEVAVATPAPEVNGTEEKAPTVETKKVEDSIPNDATTITSA